MTFGFLWDLQQSPISLSAPMDQPMTPRRREVLANLEAAHKIAKLKAAEEQRKQTDALIKSLYDKFDKLIEAENAMVSELDDPKLITSMLMPYEIEALLAEGFCVHPHMVREGNAVYLRTHQDCKKKIFFN